MTWGGRSAQDMGALCRAEYGMLCHLCLKEIVSLDEYSTDHIVPRSRGGTNAIENLRPAHKSCNYSRGNRSIEEYRAAHTDNLKWFFDLAS